MAFSNPWGFLALAAIPLVLYFHRRTPAERRMVPLVALWQPGVSGAPRGRERRSFDWILFLRLMLVVWVALALARPVWPVRAAQRHVVVLDASASMGAREEGGVRFHRALQAAGDLLTRLPPRDEVMLLRAATPPTVVHAFSSDRRSLHAAMARMAPGETPKELSAGLAMARGAFEGRSGFVHLFSDIRDTEAFLRVTERFGFSRGQVRLYPVGGRAENVGIVRLDAAALPQSPLDYEVFVQVGNFSGRPRTVELGRYLPGGRREGRRISLAPWERRPVIFSVPVAPWVEVRLEGTGDALAIDDRAVLALPATPVRALYVSGDDRFVEAALRTHPGLQIRQISAGELRSGRWSSLTADVAVVDGTLLPPDFPLPALVLGAADRADTRASRAVPVVEWQRAHPLLRQLDLSEVFVPSGAVLAPDAGDVLMRSADGPVALVAAGTGIRRAEIAFRVGRSNLGQKPAFPILMARILDWLAEPVVARSVTLRAGEPNLLDPEESNVDRSGAVVTDGTPPPVAGPTGRRDISRWVLAVALQLLSFEIWLVQRRARGGRR